MFQVELRGLERRAGFGGGGVTGLGFLTGDGGGSEQPFGARGLAAGDMGAGGREVVLRLVPAGIDGEEHVTLAHELAGLEVHGFKVARDARAELDGLGGVDVTGELLVFGDELLLDGLHRDRGCGRRDGG